MSTLDVKRTVKEAAMGLGWALLVVITAIVHYGMTGDVPVFRYEGY